MNTFHYKPLIILLLLTTLRLSGSAQSTRILIDSAAGHGFVIFDKKYAGEWADVRRIKDSINGANAGWHLPSAKEMKVLFEKTWDKRTFASSITPSDCFTSDWRTGLNDTDTVHVIGVMRGRDFKAIFPNKTYNTFFFVKDF